MFLQSVEMKAGPSADHTCIDRSHNEAEIIERVNVLELTPLQEYSCTYVAGWLERRCVDLKFADEEPEISGKVREFMREVSRGELNIPHVRTYEFVRAGLCLITEMKHQVCCQKQLMNQLGDINAYFGFGSFPQSLLKRLANVLLSGFHNLQKDMQPNAVLYQTSFKKARLS